MTKVKKVSERKEFDEQPEVTAKKVRVIGKWTSSKATTGGHANLLSTIEKKRTCSSFIEVKAKIHEMLRSPAYHRLHRYNVRAADREAIRMEQRFMKACCEVIQNAGICRKKNVINVRKIRTKQNAKKKKH